MKREAIVLGGLLHDIGKIIYRALRPEERYGKRHQELGFEWARRAGLPAEVQEVILRHHDIRRTDDKYEQLSPSAYKGPQYIKNLLYLIGEADNIAAGMERVNQNEEGEYKIEQGLGVIFDSIELTAAREQKNFWQPALLEDIPYPVLAKEAVKANTTNFYKKTWTQLCSALEDKRNFQEDRLLLLLEKYLSMVPEHSYVTIRSWPETSLHHHLKTTTALSLCTYLYIESKDYDWEKEDLKEVIKAREEERYLLVGADLSGIQNFIYTISSKAALKSVRARSFFLDLLIESASVQLCREIGLGRFNIIYASGGSFYLLAPNTDLCRSKISAFQDSFNDYLYGKFETDLYLCMAYTTLSSADLKGDTGQLTHAWGDVHRKIHIEKSRKWYGFLMRDPEDFMKPKPVTGECEVCHRAGEVKPIYLDDDILNLCSFCKSMIELGRILPKIDSFYEVIPGTQNTGFTIEIHNCVYVFNASPKEIKAQYQIRRPWDLSEGDWPVCSFPVGSYYIQQELSQLAEMAVGDKKIGVLRMDVDHLGQIFACGLKHATFARLSDLSMRLNIYFKYYLPRLLDKIRTRYLPIADRPLPINIVYAGGDDLFLIGSWDAALEAAVAINNDFRRYTGFNQDVSISGGLVVADEKVAFYKLADLAAAAEDKAKEDGRKRLGLFGTSFTWTEMEQIKAYLDLFGHALKQEGLDVKPVLFSKGFLGKLMALVEKFCGLHGGERNERMWVYSELYYLFARVKASAGDNSSARQFYQSLIAVCLDEKALGCLLLPVMKILKLLLRGEKKDGVN